MHQNWIPKTRVIKEYFQDEHKGSERSGKTLESLPLPAAFKKPFTPSFTNTFYFFHLFFLCYLTEFLFSKKFTVLVFPCYFLHLKYLLGIPLPAKGTHESSACSSLVRMTISAFPAVWKGKGGADWNLITIKWVWTNRSGGSAQAVRVVPCSSTNQVKEQLWPME